MKHNIRMTIVTASTLVLLSTGGALYVGDISVLPTASAEAASAHSPRPSPTVPISPTLPSCLVPAFPGNAAFIAGHYPIPAPPGSVELVVRAGSTTHAVTAAGSPPCGVVELPSDACVRACEVSLAAAGRVVTVTTVFVAGDRLRHVGGWVAEEIPRDLDLFGLLLTEAASQVTIDVQADRLVPFRGLEVVVDRGDGFFEEEERVAITAEDVVGTRNGENVYRAVVPLGTVTTALWEIRSGGLSVNGALALLPEADSIGEQALLPVLGVGSVLVVLHRASDGVLWLLDGADLAPVVDLVGGVVQLLDREAGVVVGKVTRVVAEVVPLDGATVRAEATTRS